MRTRRVEPDEPKLLGVRVASGEHRLESRIVGDRVVRTHFHVSFSSVDVEPLPFLPGGGLGIEEGDLDPHGLGEHGPRR